jgi:hypothetical protein
VTKKGLISLWDTPEQRESGAHDERFIDLPLTPKQVMIIEKGSPKLRPRTDLRITLGE